MYDGKCGNHISRVFSPGMESFRGNDRRCDLSIGGTLSLIFFAPDWIANLQSQAISVTLWT